MHRDLSALLRTSVPEAMEFLGTSGAVLVQLVASLRHRDDAVQGHVRKGAKALGDYSNNIIIGPCTASVARRKGRHVRPDTAVAPSRAPDHARPGEQEAFVPPVSSR